MGEIDWGGIIERGIGTVGDIFGSGGYVPGSSVDPRYSSNYPGSYVNEAGPDTGTILGWAAIGIGVFLMFSVIGKKRR